MDFASIQVTNGLWAEEINFVQTRPQPSSELVHHNWRDRWESRYNACQKKQFSSKPRTEFAKLLDLGTFRIAAYTKNTNSTVFS